MKSDVWLCAEKYCCFIAWDRFSDRMNINNRALVLCFRFESVLMRGLLVSQDICSWKLELYGKFSMEAD